jgi:hypothetical protein
MTAADRITAWLVRAALACAIVAGGTTAAAAPQEPRDALREAGKASFAGDDAALRATAARTSAWLRDGSRDERYTAAYVQFRLQQLATVAKRESDVKRHGQACTEALETVVADDPRDAEALALQSACYGYLANLGGLAAISNGRRSGRSMEAALAAAPGNPRVLLVDAIGLGFRPKIAGGDPAKAYARAREAAAAFDSAPAPDAGLAHWGHAESWYWVGRGAAGSGDAAAARRAFERALGIEPGFIAARRALAGAG